MPGRIGRICAKYKSIQFYKYINTFIDNILFTKKEKGIKLYNAAGSWSRFDQQINRFY